jgi:hypothetical protein
MVDLRPFLKHQPPAYRTPYPGTADALQRARSALHALGPGCRRAEWFRIACAAKAAGLDEDEFIDWSANAPNYKSARDCQTLWRSIKPGGGVTAGTLFGLAQAAGWDESPRPTPSRSRAFADTRPLHSPQPSGTKRFDPREVWAHCEAATSSHGYIKRKGGLSSGVRVVPSTSALRIAGQSVAGWLAVPLFDGEGEEPLSLQFISPESGKLNAPGPMSGWFTVGDKLAPGATVFVCEGIGQAWTAHQATGSTAVVAFGAGRMEQVARSLLDRTPDVRLVLVADVGQEGAIDALARSLGCAWVAPSSDLGKNGDINDLHQRDGLEAVTRLFSELREPGRQEPRYRLLTAEELSRLPPVRWRVRGVLPVEGLAALYGPPGCGKSFLVLDLLGAIADGRDWFEYRTVAAPVVYLALEGEAGIAQRMKAYVARYWQAPDQMRFVTQPFALLEAGDVAALSDAIRRAGGAGGVVVIDTLNRASPGADENDSRDMGKILAGAKALQAELGGLVLLVHHSGKDATKGLRGHSSLLAALDAAIEVKREGDLRTWTTSKAKDGADGAGHPFQLVVVDLDVDEFGERVTSCVIAPAEAPTIKLRPFSPRGENQKLVWERIGVLLRQAGENRPEGVPDDLPEGRPVVRYEIALESASEALEAVKRGRGRERAKSAIESLCSGGALVYVDGWLWCA